MEVTAKAKSVTMSPRKVRLIADAIRNKPASDAIILLEQAQKRAAGPLMKILKSAMANAKNNANLDVSGLYIKQILVVPGSVMKRFHPSSRGRSHPYKKRMSHITIVLEEKKK